LLIAETRFFNLIDYRKNARRKEKEQ